MNRTPSKPLFTVLLALSALIGCRTSYTLVKRLPYPTTAKVEQFDDYHGTKVADPYRWLEDDNAPATKD